MLKQPIWEARCPHCGNWFLVQGWHGKGRPTQAWVLLTDPLCTYCGQWPRTAKDPVEFKRFRRYGS